MCIRDRTYCQFGDVTGPPRALVLPSASQARERYAQAMAFMDQQANSHTMRHRLGPRISVGSTDCSQGCSHEAVLDVRPLNNKCPKIAEIQLTNKVGENNTDGTNTHCVDGSSHADSAVRHDLVTPAVGGLGPPDRRVGPPTWPAPVRRSLEYAPPIGWTGAPFWLLCPARRQSLLCTWSNKGVSVVLRVVDCIVSDPRDLCCYEEFVNMPRKRPALSDVEPSDSKSSSSESEAGDSPAVATQSTGAPVADSIPATASQNPVGDIGGPLMPLLQRGLLLAVLSCVGGGVSPTPLTPSTCPVPVGCVITPTFSPRKRA